MANAVPSASRAERLRRVQLRPVRISEPEAAKITGVADCAGCDIAEFPLPKGVRFVDWDEALAGAWDLVAMFDVLEHIPDLGFLARLKTRHLAVAVPYCRWRELGADGDAWFRTWRVRLPNEHLHHFDRDSLVALLAHNGFDCVTLNGFEDGIRLRPGEVGPNILSGFFRKRGQADWTPAFAEGAEYPVL
ncbi:methyltransferase domain-containing protein [Mesorhizobium sp. M1B.F.Ca.ET.045.04.1.1]|uniref:methyltransferase domain-containing protein n=1 Tax=Mesorhizobium sp. M1B.F.Ca.ET.045.04.1.1 TaxID=2493673 RepID=UPI001FDED24B|nr:methyltransferase domain-containing protein [Mesorhizobium sp. M1B.F.Ca.ET.045.04.1.1]